MTQSYEDYERDYNQNLSRVRSFLSSQARSLTTLRECDRLLSLARRQATAMQGLAEVEGDAFQIEESKRRVEREIMPLLQEVDRSMKEKENGEMIVEKSRRELFGSHGYQAPDLENGNDTDRLIEQSESLLMESQALCAETEQVGSETLQTMGRQREQLYIASDRIGAARGYVERANVLLKDMSRKAVRNKIFLYCIIGILVVANIIVLVAIIKKKLIK